MKLLNLGCGNNYHSDWINLDIHSEDKKVIVHNLRNGIPFETNSIDVIYHSHILEHFPIKEATVFIAECFRVLKTNGIIRVVVPDLEIIVKEYLDKLQKSLNGDKAAQLDYEWIMLELFDQMVRNHSGGQMAEYFHQNEISNQDFVIKRIGQEGHKIIEKQTQVREINSLNKHHTNQVNILKKISGLHKKIKRKLFSNESANQTEINKIGTFRLSGEVHQWMYDRYSLGKLLENAGFKDIIVTTAQKSNIENWSSYFLDQLPDGTVRKPDSLFIEAKK
jgi:predicted SAM-dependent methyltransferase